MNIARPPISSTDLILQAETELLTAIARLLAGGNVASADWKIDRLRRMGALNDEALAIITRYRDAVLNGIDAELEAKAFEGLRAQEKLFRTAEEDGALLKGVLPFEADPALEAVVQTWQRQGRESLSKSMAAMLQNTGQVYVDTINRTSLQVLTGGMTAREALVTTVKEWAAAGIPSITDRAGRQWSTEAYASMVLRSTSARVVADTQLTRAQQYGTDLIEVSSHLGARPLCAPHQGHIYSISGAHPKYPPLSSTSYGETAGLFGINCGHRQYPFFEGLSRKTYEPYDSEENDAAYKTSQVQRSIERSIRAAKREVAMLEAVKQPEAAAQALERVRDYQAAMRTFIEKTGRTRRRDREQIIS